jgi:hypothetical protein
VFIGGGTSSCEPTSGRPDQTNGCPGQMTPDSGAVP